MSIDSTNAAAAERIHDKIQTRMSDHEPEVLDTLRRVVSGEQSMPETLSPVERDDVIRLFQWVIDTGLLPIATTLRPLIVEALEYADDWGWRPVDPEFAANLPDFREMTKREWTRLAVLFIAYVFYDDFHYPQPETGCYDIGDAWQKLEWVYRYWFNQLEVAERGSDLEGFFAEQRLDAVAGSGESAARVSLSCGGDLLAVDVLTPENTPHLFDAIVDFYSSADIVSANLESTVDESRKIGRDQDRGMPARMNTSEAMFDKFCDEAGINYFAVATNHALDWGAEGVHATLEVLRKSSALHSGTAGSAEEQEDVPITDTNGVKVALLSYTFDLNGRPLPSDEPYLVNEVRFNDVDPAPDYSLIERQVAAARAKGADHIVAYCHWGWEFEMYPHVNIRDAAQAVIDCGVDTILGNHPHVSQPAELIPREDASPALVVYAFGDFVSYHPDSRNSKLAYLVKFDIVKEDADDGSRTHIENLESFPIYIVNADLGDRRFDCRIVPFADVLASPESFGLTDLEKEQLPHLEEKVWTHILSPISEVAG